LPAIFPPLGFACVPAGAGCTSCDFRDGFVNTGVNQVLFVELSAHILFGGYGKIGIWRFGFKGSYYKLYKFFSK
jgi:hypothetical protein